LIVAGLGADQWVGQAFAAESAGEAIKAFGLIGSWSIDCSKPPTQACTPETGCGARTIFEVSPTGSAKVRTLAGSFLPGRGMRSVESIVESAERIGDDRIRIVSVQQGVPGQFSTAMWIRQAGERWETVLLKVDTKYRWFSHQQQDGAKIAAKDGFEVRPPPGTKHDELPTNWVVSDRPTPLFERCSD
jgi:hypothetical protein